MATFSSNNGMLALVPVVKLWGYKNYKSWKRNIHALLLGQALWKHASGQVPLPITQAQKDWEESARTAKSLSEVLSEPDV